MNDKISIRDSLCLDCRTSLSQGERCDGGIGHRVTSLQSHQGRERLLSEVWGPPDVRRRLKQLAVAGSAGAAGGSIAIPGCEAGCDMLAFDPGLGLILVGLWAVAMVLYYLISRILYAIRQKRNRPRPNGATSRARPSRGRRIRGRVKEAGEHIPSVSGKPVLAYGLKLKSKHSNLSELMLTDGAGGGFAIEADDGSNIYIPPGRLRLEGKDSLARPVEERHVERYLGRLDGKYLKDPDEVLAPIPYERAEELSLQLGDAVEVLSKLHPVPDPRAPEVGYRDPAAAVLVPEGVPMLRVL